MLADYLVKTGEDHTNICFDCRRACGGCSWSAADPETGKPLFRPVPGWTAERSFLRLNRKSGGGYVFGKTWHITACPLFFPDLPRRDWLAYRRKLEGPAGSAGGANAGPAAEVETERLRRKQEEI